jgi:hypothetical protein
MNVAEIRAAVLADREAALRRCREPYDQVLSGLDRVAALGVSGTGRLSKPAIGELRLCAGPGCDRQVPVHGRGGRRFCSATCKSREYQARKKATAAAANGEVRSDQNAEIPQTDHLPLEARPFSTS